MYFEVAWWSAIPGLINHSTKFPSRIADSNGIEKTIRANIANKT